MNGKEKKENLKQWDDDDSNLAFLRLAFVAESDEWIMDSGCTYHMCPNREWFSSIIEVQFLWVMIMPVRLLGYGKLD